MSRFYICRQTCARGRILLYRGQNQIPADIISELEQIRAQYGDVPSTLANELAQTQMHSFHLKFAKSEIAHFRKKGASAVFATVVIHEKKELFASMKPNR